MTYQTGWTPIIELQGGQAVADKYDAAFNNIDLAFADIQTKLPDGYFQFVPQATEPVGITEGAMYYDLPSHSFVAINDIAGTRLNLGHEIVERCSNITGATLPDGKVIAVGNTDVDDNFEMILASASILGTAVAFGVTTSSSESGEIGLVTRMGRVNGVDTVGVGVNQSLYLSDTVPGGLTGVSPEITTVVGYVVKAQSGAGVADGVIYVSPRSIVSLPNVVAFMNQDLAWATPISLDLNRVAITTYDPLDSGKRIMTYNDVAGTITAPASGIYDVSLDFDSSFDSVTNSIRHCLVEVIEDDLAGGLVTVANYNKSIAINASTANGSMTKTFNVTEGREYHLAISSPDATLANFTLDNVSFSMKSIDIR